MNVGNRDVTTPFTIFLERDSGPAMSYLGLRSYDVPGLAAGASLVLEPKAKADNCYWFVCNPGDLSMRPCTRIRVTVDSNNVVSESLENNNQTIHVFSNW
jgi:subtilase family serine protease